MVDAYFTERIGGLRHLKTGCIGRRDGSMFKNTSFYSGGPQFTSQNPCHLHATTSPSIP